MQSSHRSLRSLNESSQTSNKSYNLSPSSLLPHSTDSTMFSKSAEYLPSAGKSPPPPSPLQSDEKRKSADQQHTTTFRFDPFFTKISSLKEAVNKNLSFSSSIAVKTDSPSFLARFGAGSSSSPLQQPASPISPSTGPAEVTSTLPFSQTSPAQPKSPNQVSSLIGSPPPPVMTLVTLPRASKRTEKKNVITNQLDKFRMSSYMRRESSTTTTEEAARTLSLSNVIEETLPPEQQQPQQPQQPQQQQQQQTVLEKFSTMTKMPLHHPPPLSQSSSSSSSSGRVQPALPKASDKKQSVVDVIQVDLFLNKNHAVIHLFFKIF